MWHILLREFVIKKEYVEKKVFSNNGSEIPFESFLGKISQTKNTAKTLFRAKAESCEVWRWAWPNYLKYIPQVPLNPHFKIHTHENALTPLSLSLKTLTRNNSKHQYHGFGVLRRKIGNSILDKLYSPTQSIQSRRGIIHSNPSSKIFCGMVDRTQFWNSTVILSFQQI